MTTVIPHKNFEQKKVKNKVILNNKDLKQRKGLLKLQSKTRGNHLYLLKMKKMVKKVSTIIYYHILHSHNEQPKPSKAANLFNEKKILEEKEVKHMMIMDAFSCISTGIIFHTERTKFKVKINTEFSKNMI